MSIEQNNFKHYYKNVVQFIQTFAIQLNSFSIGVQVKCTSGQFPPNKHVPLVENYRPKTCWRDYLSHLALKHRSVSHC